MILAVRRLWDTWEDEILASRHESDVAGDALSVTGQGLLPRPPQGSCPCGHRRPSARRQR